MKKSMYLTILFSVTLFAASALFAADPVPFPQDLKIVAPDKGMVPERLAEYSGIWGGNWSYTYGRGLQLAKIAVEEITPAKATVVYGWGAAEFVKSFYSVNPGWHRSKDCPVEKAADGSFVITVKTPRAVLILRQKDSKDKISVTQKSEMGSSEYTTLFERTK